VRLRRRGVLPGFIPTLGYTIFYLGLVVLLPLAALLRTASGQGWHALWTSVTNSRALAAYGLSFGAAAIGALFDTVFGLVVAWVLVRYRFPGQRIVDALVDLPFALPTAVAGIAMTTAYGDTGLLGAPLAKLHIKVAFTPIGIVVVLMFVGLPFVVRTLQPVLEDLDPDLEEVAAVLGATRWQTFSRVILPPLVPALLTGFTLSFARGLGEYGSVIFISGNVPRKTEIVPHLIMTKLEQYDYAGATALASVVLVAAFGLFLAINVLQRWSRGAAS
jgi:sulfate transport system permease protein